MPIYLDALALRNYRGIGDKFEIMPEFKEFNFFIGANNAGKSTILNFLSRYMPPKFQSGSYYREDTPYVVDDLERHGGKQNVKIEVGIGFPINSVNINLKKEFTELKNIPFIDDILLKIIKHLSDGEGKIWKYGPVPYTEKLSLHRAMIPKWSTSIDESTWRKIWNAVTRQTGGSRENWVSETINRIDDVINVALPKVRLIPAIRQIGPKGGAFDDYSGTGLIDRLATIQNPEHDKREDRRKFERINGFLRHVTAKDNAEIEIPYSRDHVLVHMDDRVLPLSSLGTGIHEVIMIAAFCTLAENEIVCIEEPEIHLHPLLQRKLIRYLKNQTKNQYFIATHSAAFIDTPDSAIFHVYQENNTTHIREALLKKERYAICADLGHRASDIVQANAVIWVEGPSDRIYLNHWLKIAAPDLIEGVHYSIMFYGGRLLSHLAADDAEVSDFIQLRNLNRNVAIIMDSDKKTARSPINATKQRLRHEFSDHGGIAWITKGREIENYIDHKRLQTAVALVYKGTYGSPLGGEAFDHALHFQRTAPKKVRKGGVSTGSIETEVDKVKVSRAIADDGIIQLDVLDLKERVTEIVELVREANS